MGFPDKRWRRSKSRNCPGFLWIIPGLVVLLQSCAIFETPLEIVQNPATRRQLAVLEMWRMEGRVGVRRSDESWHAGLVWRHARDFDHLTISGPFGQGALDIQVTENYIRVTSADGKVEESRNPEQLLETIIGIAVPVPALRYWLLGLAYPSVESDSEYDSLGRLIKLSQLGWVARYQDYQTVQQWSVPKKLSVVNAATRFRLVIDEWRLSGSDD
ncbi:MAG: lipoprotein insertase outer membrane protein LolB [Methylococcales bacterium]